MTARGYRRRTNCGGRGQNSRPTSTTPASPTPASLSIQEVTTSKRPSNHEGQRLQALLALHLLQVAQDLKGTETAVSAEGPDGGDLPGPRPSGHGLGVDPEHLGDL